MKEIEEIDSEIRKYQEKIKELQEKRARIIKPEMQDLIGKYVKILYTDSKNYMYIRDAKPTEGGIFEIMLTGLTIHKSFGNSNYFIIQDDCIYVRKDDIIEILKEEFEEVLSKAINQIKSVV